MAYSKIIFFSAAFFLFLALSLAAPTDTQAEVQKEDLILAEKEDLNSAASHWGGHYGGWGGHWGGHYGGYYPYGYGNYWGWPGYGYGYGYGWPYGGHYGHHGYWW